MASLFASEDERGVIASMLLDPECVPTVTPLVGPLDFGDAVLRVAYESIVSQYRETKTVDPIAVRHVLRDDPSVDNANAVLADLAEAVTTSAHAKTFAAQVKDASLKRRILDVTAVAHRAAQDGQTGADVLAQLYADSEDLLRLSERREPFKKGNLASFVSKYPRQKPPVIDGIIREGETCNIIAASKVGKSWLSYGLALSVANNERWLGLFDVADGRVLLVDNELTPETLASRLPTVADAMGVDLDTVDRDIDIWSLRGNLQSLEDLGAEFDRIEPGEYKLIILDAFYRFAQDGVSENDNAAMTRVYNLLDRYAAKTEAAFIVIHHASKGSQAGKSVTDVGAGAGSQSRAADCHLVIRPHEEEGCAVLEGAVRSFAPISPVPLRWAFPLWIADHQLDPKKLAGRLGEGQKVKAEEDQADRNRILETLQNASEPLTRKKLRKAVGIGDDRIKRLLDRMESERLIDSIETTIRGNVTDAYTPRSGVVDDVDGPRSDHQTTGQTEGVGGPLKGADHVPPGLRDGEPGDEREPSTSGHVGGDIPFPEFADYAEGAV